jgi:hypothetical protein
MCTFTGSLLVWVRSTGYELQSRKGWDMVGPTHRMPEWFFPGSLLVPYCVLNRFGLRMPEFAGKPQQLVVGHKTYDCPYYGLKSQTVRLRAVVSWCECELLDGQCENRLVVNLVDNPAFKPAKPTGLEGILG